MPVIGLQRHGERLEHDRPLRATMGTRFGQLRGGELAESRLRGRQDTHVSSLRLEAVMHPDQDTLRNPKSDVDAAIF
jgi:hypothetical protein